MFFKSMQTLLTQVVSLSTSMVENEDKTITVTVIPKAKKEGEANASLNTPLVLTGTAEELDAEFANLLASYTGKRSSLAEQLEATEAVLEAAKKEATKKATKAVTSKPAKPVKPNEKSSGDDDGDDGDESGEASAGLTPQAAGEKSAATGGENNLWD